MSMGCWVALKLHTVCGRNQDTPVHDIIYGWDSVLCVVAPVPCVVPLIPCVVPLVPCVVPLVPCIVPLVPCVVPLVPCVVLCVSGPWGRANAGDQRVAPHNHCLKKYPSSPRHRAFGRHFALFRGGTRVNPLHTFKTCPGLVFLFREMLVLDDVECEDVFLYISRDHGAPQPLLGPVFEVVQLV